MKKRKYSCLEKNTVRFENPVEKLARWGGICGTCISVCAMGTAIGIYG